MPVSAAMKTHLEGDTWLAPLWKMTAVNGSVVAYAGHTRQLVFNSVTYKVAAVDFARSQRRLGLEPNVSDLVAPLDGDVTEVSIHAGKWKHARIEKEWVNYRDLTMGSVYREVGFVGKIKPNKRAGIFTVEFQSLAQQLHQLIGDVTEPTDTRAAISELGIDPAPYTFSRTVTAVASRQVFTVGGAALTDNDFRYGKVTWATGANSVTPGREIKSNAGNVITLQYAMHYNIAIGDSVTLVKGYDGTRASAKALGVMDTFRGFPDLPGLSNVLRFPE